MMASDGASCFAHCFSILFGMLSGPDALDGLMFLSSFSTPSVFIFIDGIVDFRFMWVSGMLSMLPQYMFLEFLSHYSTIVSHMIKHTSLRFLYGTI